MTFPPGVLQPWIRLVSVAFGADSFLLLIHVVKYFIHPLIRLVDDVDGGRLTGTWHYLDGKYLAPCACLEQLLACLVLDPQLAAIGVFGGPAPSTWIFVIVFFAMLLHATTLSTCVIAFLTCGHFEHTSQSIRIYRYTWNCRTLGVGILHFSWGLRDLR